MVVEGLRYLVIKALAGNFNIIDAVYRYIVEEVSPGYIRDSMGITPSSLKGYVHALKEKCGSVASARKLLSLVYPALLRMKPVVVMVDGKYRCRLCNAVVLNPEQHLARAHPDLVEEAVSRVASLAIAMKRGGVHG